MKAKLPPPSHPFTVIFELIIRQDGENPVTETDNNEQRCSAARGAERRERER